MGVPKYHDAVRVCRECSSCFATWRRAVLGIVKQDHKKTNSNTQLGSGKGDSTVISLSSREQSVSEDDLSCLEKVLGVAMSMSMAFDGDPDAAWIVIPLHRLILDILDVFSCCFFKVARMRQGDLRAYYGGVVACLKIPKPRMPQCFRASEGNELVADFEDVRVRLLPRLQVLKRMRKKNFSTTVWAEIASTFQIC